MKHLFKVLLISLAFVGCKQKIQSTDISKINGYWEIEKVVFDIDGVCFKSGELMFKSMIA